MRPSGEGDFVFQNPRAELLRGVAAGSEPDSTLLGANHLAGHGIDARVHDALLTRRPLPAPVDRLAWNLRELTLPFELGRTDVLFTPIANVAPLGARVRPAPDSRRQLRAEPDPAARRRRGGARCSTARCARVRA